MSCLSTTHGYLQKDTLLQILLPQVEIAILVQVWQANYHKLVVRLLFIDFCTQFRVSTDEQMNHPVYHVPSDHLMLSG